MSNTTKVIIIVGGTILLLMGCSSLGLSLLLSSEMNGDGDITIATLLCFSLPGLLFSGLGIGMIYQAWRAQAAQHHSQHASSSSSPSPGAGPGFAPPGTGWSAPYSTGQTTWQQGNNANIDEQIRQAAVQRDYRVTASDVAMLSDLSLERARNRLEELAQQGLVTAEIGENREIVYTFRQT